MTKTATNSPPPPLDVKTLARAELQAGAWESKLLAEWERLTHSAQELLPRAVATKAALDKLPQDMRGKPALAAAARALSTPPTLPDVQALLGETLSARTEVIQARKRAAESTQATLSSAHAQLGALVEAVRVAEQAIAAVQARSDTGAKSAAQGDKPVTRTSPPALPSVRTQVPRVQMQASVDLKSDSNFYVGFSTNLSEGGLFIATVQCPPKGTPVDLQFSIPGGQVLRVQGVVRWVREVNDKNPEIFPGVGVQFVSPSPAALEVIRSFVQKREPMFYPD
ncbi:MAG: TIGR02266 family protein [Myxococcaceae bacterium]